MRSFRLETTVYASPAECFDLALSIDAHQASMSGSGEQAIGPRTSGILTLGDEVTWRARHFGLPFTMTSAITAYEPPSRFVDEQQRGPFGSWWHEHTFTRVGTGATLMTDTVRYSAPLGLLGKVAERSVLDRYMRQLLSQRNAWLKGALEG